MAIYDPNGSDDEEDWRKRSIHNITPIPSAMQQATTSVFGPKSPLYPIMHTYYAQA